MEASQSQPGCAASPATSDAQPSAAWTPGPWHVIRYDAGDDDALAGMPSVVAAPELDCAIVHTKGFAQRHWRSARGDAEIHANARLIAAAPDMADAIRTACDLLAERTYGNHARSPGHNARLVLEAALRKATETK